MAIGFGKRNLTTKMQSLTEKIFKFGPPGGVFDETVVRCLFPASTEGARKQLVFVLLHS